MPPPSLDHAHFLTRSLPPQESGQLTARFKSRAAATDTSPARLIALPDGRRLAYAEYGDEQGYPLFYCHSQGSSRLEGRFFQRDALSAGFRIIAVDRPGIGFSDPRSGMKHRDFGKDMLFLADSMGIEEFALMAWAGGAPFAFALAEACPERVKLLISLASLPARSSIKPAATLGDGLSQLSQAAMRALIGLRQLISIRNPQQYLKQLQGNVCFADRKLLEDSRHSDRLLETLQEATRQGGSQLIRDASRCFDSWDFEVETIQVPVHLWHGTADNQVPVHYSTGLANRLPGAILRTVRSRGHMFFMQNAEKILQLAAAELQEGEKPGLSDTWRDAGVARVHLARKSSHAETQLVDGSRLAARLLQS